MARFSQGLTRSELRQLTRVLGVLMKHDVVLHTHCKRCGGSVIVDGPRRIIRHIAPVCEDFDGVMKRIAAKRKG